MAAESCVKWTNFHEHIKCAMREIFESHQYTDCRLVVPEGELYANRAILCMASKFFETIFDGVMNMSAIETDRLTVLIPDLKFSCLRAILQFIYIGEIYLRPHDVAPFVDACSFLQIQGVSYSEERTVGINFETFISSVHEGSIVNIGGYENSAYLSNDLKREGMEQHSTSELGEGSDPLEIQNASVLFFAQQVSLGESLNDHNSALDCEIENEDSNATVTQQLLREGIGLSCSVANSTLQCNSKMDVEKNQSSTIYALNDRLDKNVNSQCAEDLDTSSYDSRLNAAIDAILKRGISYGVASKQYNISKTVLWRRTMKMARLVRPTSPKLAKQRREAIDALKSGEKLVHVSQRFEVPLSTLHRDKIRLYKKGILPSKVTLKQRDKGESFQQRLTEAVTECIEGRMSLSEAARVYELPKTSIWRKVRSSRPGNSCTGAIEVERNQTKCDHGVNCTETVEENAEPTVGDLLSATLHMSSEYMSDPSIGVSASGLTQDSIIL